MNIGYVLPYQAAIAVHPDGEVRFKAERIGRDRQASESGCRPPLARTKKSRKPLKALLERRVDKIKNFTNHARNTLKRAATAIEKTYGLERCGFLTLTCPGSTYEARRVYARAVGYMVGDFRRWASYHFKSMERGIPLVVVAEMQTRRATPACHLHILIPIPDGETWESFKEKVDGWYFRFLCRISDAGRCDVFERRPGWSWRDKWDRVRGFAVDINPVQKSVAGYLSKYMSKGCELPPGFPPNLTPDAWWFMNDSARECMNTWTIRLPIGRVSRGQLEDMNLMFEAAMKEVARDVRPLVNPYTQDWIGGIAYGDRGETLPLAQDLAMIFKRFTQDMMGNAQRLREEWREWWSGQFEKSEARGSEELGCAVNQTEAWSDLEDEWRTKRKYAWAERYGLERNYQESLVMAI